MELLSSSPEYHTSSAQKARSKIAAHRFKYGSPKLVDMMRDKCRLRIKEARNQYLFQKRNIVQEEQILLASIVRQELTEIEQDIELQELIFQELMAATDEWLFEEYERSESYMIDEYDQPVVFCPVCQKSDLKEAIAGIIQCDCNVKVQFPDGLEVFGRMLRDTVEDHGQNCPADLQFFIEPLTDCKHEQLYTFCSECDYFKKLSSWMKNVHRLRVTYFVKQILCFDAVLDCMFSTSFLA